MHKGGRVLLKRDGTRWRTGGEVKRKMANGVGSQYSSHYLWTWCIQHYYRWCAHLGCQQSTELRPCRFKWTRPFRRKTKSGFCACAITFQLASTSSHGIRPHKILILITRTGSVCYQNKLYLVQRTAQTTCYTVSIQCSYHPANTVFIRNFGVATAMLTHSLQAI